MDSTLQKTRQCIVCGATESLERHHCIFGSAKRKLAEEDGLWVWMCHKHHAAVHFDDTYTKEMLQQMAQRAYEKKYDHRKWMARYRRNYL